MVNWPEIDVVIRLVKVWKSVVRSVSREMETSVLVVGTSEVEVIVVNSPLIDVVIRLVRVWKSVVRSVAREMETWVSVVRRVSVTSRISVWVLMKVTGTSVTRTEVVVKVVTTVRVSVTG